MQKIRENKIIVLSFEDIGNDAEDTIITLNKNINIPFIPKEIILKSFCYNFAASVDTDDHENAITNFEYINLNDDVIEISSNLFNNYVFLSFATDRFVNFNPNLSFFHNVTTPINGNYEFKFKSLSGAPVLGVFSMILEFVNSN